MSYLVGNRNFLEWFSDYFCHFLQQFEINTVGGGGGEIIFYFANV